MQQELLVLNFFFVCQVQKIFGLNHDIPLTGCSHFLINHLKYQERKCFLIVNDSSVFGKNSWVSRILLLILNPPHSGITKCLASNC